jgi:cell filamentation protein, protein adenylyltransferase
MFDTTAMLGDLVPINGNDPIRGTWEHRAFLPYPLPAAEPPLSGQTYRQVARARAAIATLDSTARQLPNPSLLRRPALGREAQSTSALEGTYAPLRDVLTEDEQAPSSMSLREIFNYIHMANQAFAWLQDGRPLAAGVLADLQKVLFRGTPGESMSMGRIRDDQVVIGLRAGAPLDEFPVKAARFVPAPPGLDLEARTSDLVEWVKLKQADAIDPVVAAAMAHYQFEALHPFHDGNGRVGRLLILMQLLLSGILSEPTLSVSPWFEARRADYYDKLLAVSCQGAWDEWVRFFASGIEASAIDTHRQMKALLGVQYELHEKVRASNLRSDNAHKLVDLAVARPSFSARQAKSELAISYGRANGLISQLVELGLLEPVYKGATYDRRFEAPKVMQVLLGDLR